MMKKLAFDIQNPLGATEIATTRSQAATIAKWAPFIGFFSFVLGIYLGYKFLDQFLPSWTFTMGSFFSAYTFVVGSIMIAASVISVTALLVNPYVVNYQRTSPLQQPWQAKEILEWTARFAELEHYRLQIATVREFVEGDYEAMEDFAKKAQENALQESLKEKQNQVLEELHQVQEKLHSVN